MFHNIKEDLLRDDWKSLEAITDTEVFIDSIFEFLSFFNG